MSQPNGLPGLGIEPMAGRRKHEAVFFLFVRKMKTAFAKPGMPWELKYFETFPTKKEAVAHEMALKKRKDRNYLIKLIGGSEHPGRYRPGGSQVRIL